MILHNYNESIVEDAATWSGEQSFCAFDHVAEELI